MQSIGIEINNKTNVNVILISPGLLSHLIIYCNGSGDFRFVKLILPYARLDFAHRNGKITAERSVQAYRAFYTHR